ncbi:MAG: hypothetical protein JSU03_13095 [Bacteroidetes bacterium]|nr:hypothetical protein [Bacteroidota bacterium]
MKRSVYKILSISIVTILIILFFFYVKRKAVEFFKKDAKEWEAVRKEELPLAYEIPKEYEFLFNKLYQGNLSPNMVRRSKIKYRNPVAMMDFDNKYKLFIYKIDMQKDTSLQKEFFTTKSYYTKRQTGIIYAATDVGGYIFENKSGAINKAPALFFSYASDTLYSFIKNDSIIAFSLSTDNFAIKYAEKEIADLIVQGRDNGIFGNEMNYFDVLFYRKKDAVYLLTLTPNDPSIKMPQDLLYKIISK